MTVDRSKFGFESSTTDVLYGIDLTGKTVLITGGTSGLGTETARAMAAHGADVTITARSPQKAAKVVESIRNETGSTIGVEELELASFNSIRACADRIVTSDKQFNILINNAGIMACPHGKTEDGFELQFGTNHLGHFLLTNLITPCLQGGGRVVALSSSAHRFSPVVFDDINFENREYDPRVSYGQSKTANALFAVSLNARLKGHGIEAFAVHPGVIFTELTRHIDPKELEGLGQRLEAAGTAAKSVQQGAATQIYAATAPELTGKGGHYLSDCSICPVDTSETVDVFNQGTVLPYAVDPAQAERLWTISEKMVGKTFTH